MLARPEPGRGEPGPSPSPSPSPPRFRPATSADAEALRDLEREANLVALAHVFPRERFPFPDEEVLARWRSDLRAPEFRIDVVDVVDGSGGLDRVGRLDCYIGHDDHVIRHLAVRPEVWGRGLGRAAVEQAAARMTEPTLWCLDLNLEAQAFYRRLGWRPTGRTRPGEWPPYPTMSEWQLPRA